MMLSDEATRKAMADGLVRIARQFRTRALSTSAWAPLIGVGRNNSDRVVEVLTTHYQAEQVEDRWHMPLTSAPPTYFREYPADREQFVEQLLSRIALVCTPDGTNLA